MSVSGWPANKGVLAEAGVNGVHDVTFVGELVELAMKKFHLGGVSADEIGLVGSPGFPMMTVSVGAVGVGSR